MLCIWSGLSTNKTWMGGPPQFITKCPPLICFGLLNSNTNVKINSSLRVIPPELLFHYFQHSKKNLGNSVKASQRATYPGNENKWTDIRLHPTTAQHTVVSFSRINLWYTAENSHWACCHFCNRHSWRRLSSQFIPLAQWQPAATVAPWGHVIHTPMSHVHTFLC